MNEEQQPLENAKPEWMQGLHDPELTEDKFLMSVKDVETLARHSVASKKTLSRKIPDRPGADATPEQINEYYKNLGRPETPDKYEVGIKVKGEEGGEVPFQIADENVDNLFRSMMHSAGVDDRGFNAALSTYLEWEGRLLDKSQNQLKTEWNVDYEKNTAIAKKFFSSLPEDLQKAVDSSFGKNPTILKLLHHLGQDAYSGSTAPESSGSGNVGGDVNQMKNRRSAILSDPAFLNRQHPNHVSVNREYDSIAEKLHKAGVLI